MSPHFPPGHLFLREGIIFVDKKFCSPVSTGSPISNGYAAGSGEGRFPNPWSPLKQLQTGGPEAAGMGMKTEKGCAWQ